MKLDWYKLEPYRKNIDKAPDVDGVYTLCTLQDNNKYKVRYVGQGNLAGRLKYHLSNQEENEPLKEHIAKGYTMKAVYARVSKKSDRDGIELFLYNHFKPKFNKYSPPAEQEIGVNLFSLDYEMKG